MRFDMKEISQKASSEALALLPSKSEEEKAIPAHAVLSVTSRVIKHIALQTSNEIDALHRRVDIGDNSMRAEVATLLDLVGYLEARIKTLEDRA